MSDRPIEYFELTGSERRQFHTALLSGFETRAKLAELVAFELNQELEAIVGGESRSEVVLQLIRWAESQGRILELARAAQRQVPGNARLVKALEVLEATAVTRAQTLEQEEQERRQAAEKEAREKGEETRRWKPAKLRTREPEERDQSEHEGNSDPGEQEIPRAPSATLGFIQIVHNLMVPHPRGLAPGPGMSLTLPGTLMNAVNRSLQLAVRFMMPNGQCLIAHPQEPAFRDATNYCAAYTLPVPVAMTTTDLSAFPMTIPYYCLNLTPTNGMMLYQLSALAAVYVDHVMIAQSQPMPFSLRW